MERDGIQTVHESRLASLTTAGSVRELEDEVGAGLIECDCVLCCDAVFDGIKLDEADGRALLVLLHATSDVARVALEEHGELELVQVGRKITRKNRLGGLLGRIGLLRHGDGRGRDGRALSVDRGSGNFGHGQLIKENRSFVHNVYKK